MDYAWASHRETVDVSEVAIRDRALLCAFERILCSNAPCNHSTIAFPRPNRAIVWRAQLHRGIDAAHKLRNQC